MAQAQGQVGQRGQPEQSKDPDQELGGAAGVHQRAPAAAPSAASNALPARKWAKISSPDPITSFTVPLSQTLPRCIKATRSEISNTCGTSWLTITTVSPNLS